MGDMTIRPLDGKVFGATVTGVDLRNLSDGEFAEVRSGFLEHGFLLFPGQHLDEQASSDFGRRWGEQDGSRRDHVAGDRLGEKLGGRRAGQLIHEGTGVAHPDP